MHWAKPLECVIGIITLGQNQEAQSRNMTVLGQSPSEDINVLDNCLMQKLIESS